MSDGQITNGQREGHDFPPLNAAWLMACAARDAAAAWTQPGPPEDVPDLADHLQHAFRSLSHALLSLTCCIDCTPPHEREPHSFEVSQHVYRASMVIDQAGAVLLRDLPLRPGPRTSSAAAEAGYELARRISSAYLSIGKPSSTTPAVRTATIEAFRHATGDLSVVAGTLAAQLPARWQRSCRTPAHAGSPRRKPASPKLMSIWPARWNAPVSARGSQAGAPSHSERATAMRSTAIPGPARRSPRPARRFQLSRLPGRGADRGLRREPGALAPAAAAAHAVLTEHAMTGTSGRLPGAMPAAATQSNSRPLTHHRSRGHYSRPGKQPGFSRKGRQLWQIQPSPNGYRISRQSARHASSSPRPRTRPAPGNSQ